MTTKEQVTKLHSQGVSQYAIAKQLGIDKNSVRYHLSIRERKRLKLAHNLRIKNYRITLKQQAGGKCSRCGYDKCLAALHFHHTDPTQKSHTISERCGNIGIIRLKREADKCILLCANCHAELHEEGR